MLGVCSTSLENNELKRALAELERLRISSPTVAFAPEWLRIGVAVASKRESLLSPGRGASPLQQAAPWCR